MSCRRGLFAGRQLQEPRVQVAPQVLQRLLLELPAAADRQQRGLLALSQPLGREAVQNLRRGLRRQLRA